MPEILPHPLPGDHRQHTLTGLTANEITAILGFGPNVEDDTIMVGRSWGFTVDGERCGIWGLGGSHKTGIWSAFGPENALASVFGHRLASSPKQPKPWTDADTEELVRRYQAGERIHTIADAMGRPLSNVGKKLAALRNAGLLEGRHRGRWELWRRR